MTDRSIGEEIIDHYDSYDESSRLTGGFGLFELARTKELVARYLPGSPAVILDVGGATGIYSFWLAALGHSVHLMDIVPKHIEQAQQTSAISGSARLAGMSVGDARKLDFPDNFADVVVMHGPLYHHPARDDRLLCLTEARRVLRPGGVLLAFVITRYAGIIYGLTKGYVFDADFLHMIKDEIATGLRNNPPSWLKTFPNAFFHLPDELRDEIVEAGLVHKQTLGVIGPAWLVTDLDTCWQDEEKREMLMEVARSLEHEPVLGPRMMAVASNLRA